MVNLGDIIFQLFTLLVPIGLIFLIIYFIRSSKRNNEQLKRMEEKIDRLRK